MISRIVTLNEEIPELNKIEYIKDSVVLHDIIGNGVDIVFLDAIPSTVETRVNTDITLLIQSNIHERVKIEVGDGSNRYVDLIDMEAEVTISYATPGIKCINVLAGSEVCSLQINII